MIPSHTRRTRIRIRALRPLIDAVHAEVNRRTWETLDKLVRYRRSAGLDDALTRTLEGLIWAEQERTLSAGDPAGIVNRPRPGANPNRGGTTC